MAALARRGSVISPIGSGAIPRNFYDCRTTTVVGGTPMRKFWFGGFISLGLFALLLLGACGDDDSDDSSSGDGGEHADDGDGTQFDREINVVMSDQLRFEPDTIRVKVGERIRLVVDNEESKALHDFTVQMMSVHDVMVEGAEHGAHGADPAEFALHVAAEVGEHGVLLFTPMEAGEYEYFCSVPGHAGAGMRGTIVVEG